MAYQSQLLAPRRCQSGRYLVEIQGAPTLESQTRGAPGLMNLTLKLHIGDGRVELQVLKMNPLKFTGDLSRGLQTQLRFVPDRLPVSSNFRASHGSAISRQPSQILEIGLSGKLSALRTFMECEQSRKRSTGKLLSMSIGARV